MSERSDTFSSLSDRDSQFPMQSMQQLVAAGFFSREKTITPSHIYQLASHCLESAFVFSQFRGALDRVLEWSPHHEALTALTTGKAFATLGISQLSTSHQHKDPALMVSRTADGWRLHGFAPWVTGARHVDFFLLGAKNSADQHLLFLVPQKYVSVHTAWPLTAFNACDTARVSIDTIIPKECFLHCTTAGKSTKTGSMRSAAMALGVVSQSLSIIAQQVKKRPELRQTQQQIQEQLDQLEAQLFHDVDRIAYRLSVNQLALSSAQQALVATKGKGFLLAEKASTLCQQALFFLVWSCPEAVQHKHLGIT